MRTSTHLYLRTVFELLPTTSGHDKCRDLIYSFILFYAARENMTDGQ